MHCVAILALHYVCLSPSLLCVAIFPTVDTLHSQYVNSEANDQLLMPDTYEKPLNESNRHYKCCMNVGHKAGI